MKLHLILLLSLLAAPSLAQTGNPGPQSTVDNPDIDFEDFRPTCEIDEDCLSGLCENGPQDENVQGIPGIFYCGDPPEGCDPDAPARFDGICNNVIPGSQQFGAREHLQLRRIPGRFAITEQLDGGTNINDPRLELVRPRDISDFIGNQISSIPNPFGASTLLVYMGQFIDHDLTLIEFEPERDLLSGSPPLANRFEIELSVHVEGSDPVLNPNALTAWLDLSQVYGSDPETAEALRDPDNRERLAITLRAGDEFLPRADIINQDEILVATAMSPLLPGLFAAGDIRTNEQVMLSSFHTLFMREHNRLVAGFPVGPGQFTEDQAFENARRINIAQWQNIVLNEYFPQWHGIGINELPLYTGYNETESPDIDIFFSTTTYRFGHTGVVDYVARRELSGADESIFLGNAFFNPNVVTQNGGIDSLLNGARTQCHERIDTSIVNGIRNFLFGNIPGSDLENMDLLSFNLARGRDHEVPTYNSARRFFGLPEAQSFLDITGPDNPCLAELLEDLFIDVVNCDPFICGLAEPATRGEMGELFFASQQDQFRRSRDADRFYFENDRTDANGRGPQLFLPNNGGLQLLTDDTDRLQQIRETTMRDILDRNTFTNLIADGNPQAFQADACCKTIDDGESTICVRQRATNFRRFEPVDFERCEEAEQLENLNFFQGTMNPLSLRTYSCTCRVLQDTQQTVQFRIVRQNRPAGETDAAFLEALRGEMNLVTTEQQRGPTDRYPPAEFSLTDMGDEVEVYTNIMATDDPEDYYAAEELIGEMEYRLSQNALGSDAIMSLDNMQINCMDCSPLPLAAEDGPGETGGTLLGLSTAAGAGVIAAIVVAALVIVGCGVRFVMKRNQPVTYTSGQESV